MNAQVQPPPEAPKGANTIVICCKLPNGLQLEIGKPFEDGYRTFTLNGPAKGKSLVDGTGYALTTIPKDFWDEWLAYSPRDPQTGKVIAKEPHKALPFIRNKLVFAHQERDYVEAHAVEYAGARTGLEALDPAKLPKGLDKFKAD